MALPMQDLRACVSRNNDLITELILCGWKPGLEGAWGKCSCISPAYCTL